MEDFRNNKGYAYYSKVHGKDLEHGCSDNENDIDMPIARHLESKASSELHDSDNEPSGDENDAIEFDVQVERELFRIDTDVGGDVESDRGDSEELKNFYSSEEKGDIERRRFPQFNVEKDMEDPHFEKGQEFADFSTFKRAVKNYSIKSKRQIKI
ncbi:hypothetical protein LINPERHAP2_LOCUS33666 [Linum perenne]